MPEPPAAVEGRGPSAQPYEPNAILRWFYGRFFAHIDVDERWREVVSRAASRGVVVHVMRSISFLDFLCLDFLLKRFALPLVHFVNDLGLWILEPFGKGGRRLRLRRQIPEERALAQVVQEAGSALLFLRGPPRLGAKGRRGGALESDLIRTLVETQRKIEQPILLVPQTFVWTKLPAHKKRTILDVVFGPSEWPGLVRVFFQFLLNYRNALLRPGEPFDLGAFMDVHQDLTDGQIADKVRWALLRILERERTVVLGPRKKSPGRIREELLRSPRVRKHVESEGRAHGKPEAKVLSEARKELRRLCADQNPYVLGVLHRVLEWVWSRIYDGLEVDTKGLERAREAARQGSLVLLPSHKSHIDYLILSDVLYAHGMSPPLIAAGDNLSFWPLGPVLRRAGAFFIRRSFRGRKLYSALVDAYMRKLLAEGFHVEFFLEGGRSRTGKLLPPKLGLLSMIVDAALSLPGRKLHFLPISIGYERVIEQRSYVDEATGGDKPKENLGQLLQTPKVLRSRYGRLYVQLGEPLSFSDAVRDVLAKRRGERASGEPEADPARPPSPAERRALVQHIAHRVVYEINAVTVVTPAALVSTVLLSHRKRGIDRAALLHGCALVARALRSSGAHFARSLLQEGGQGGQGEVLREDTVFEAIRLFVDGKLVVQDGEGPEAIFAIPEERRMALEYYKNNILHFFVARALVSAALVGGGDTELVGVETLRGRVRQLSRLFKYEFMYRADVGFDAIFDETLATMREAGEVEVLAESVRVAEGDASELVRLLASMIRTYFESYRLAVRACRPLVERPLSRKEWTKRALSTGRRMYLAGELELHESLSKLRLENALAGLRDLGVVRFGEHEAISLGGEAVDAAALEALERQLSATMP